VIRSNLGGLWTEKNKRLARKASLVGRPFDIGIETHIEHRSASSTTNNLHHLSQQFTTLK